MHIRREIRTCVAKLAKLAKSPFIDDFGTFTGRNRTFTAKMFARQVGKVGVANRQTALNLAT